MMRTVMRMVMMVMMVMGRMKMPAAVALGSTARPISRALTDQLDLKYFKIS